MTTDTPTPNADKPLYGDYGGWSEPELNHAMQNDFGEVCKHGQLARSCEVCQLERDLSACRAALRDCAYTLKIVCSVWPARNRPFSTSDDGKLVSVDPEATMAAARAILPPVEGENALCRCGHYKRNHGNPIFPCMADGCSCAGFRLAKVDGK